MNARENPGPSLADRIACLEISVDALTESIGKLAAFTDYCLKALSRGTGITIEYEKEAQILDTRDDLQP